MSNDGNEQDRFAIIKPSQPIGLNLNLPRPYDGRAFTTTAVTSVGLEMSRAISSAVILEPGENLLSPDFFAFVVLPPLPDAKPGTERESVPVVSRTTTDSLGPQLARGVAEETEKQIEEWKKQGTNWRWITLELPPEPTPELQRLFIQHHVDIKKGEGLRFLAYGGKSGRTVSTPKLPAGTK